MLDIGISPSPGCTFLLIPACVAILINASRTSVLCIYSGFVYIYTCPFLGIHIPGYHIQYEGRRHSIDCHGPPAGAPAELFDPVSMQ